MSKISFEGIGEVAATFACGDGVTAGQVVKVTGNGRFTSLMAYSTFSTFQILV